MDKKSRFIKQSFRCSEQEAAQLLHDAERSGLSMSEYVRQKLFDTEGRHLPPEVNELMRELRNDVLKLGTEANQIFRGCREKNFVTTYDYRELVALLDKIDEKYCEALKQLRLINQ